MWWLSWILRNWLIVSVIDCLSFTGWCTQMSTKLDGQFLLLGWLKSYQNLSHSWCRFRLPTCKFWQWLLYAAERETTMFKGRVFLGRLRLRWSFSGSDVGWGSGAGALLCGGDRRRPPVDHAPERRASDRGSCSHPNHPGKEGGLGLGALACNLSNSAYA